MLRLTSVTWAFVSSYLNVLYCHAGAQRCCRWLRHCATSQKVTGSIPYGFDGILYWHNPCGRTMTIWLAQPLTNEYQEYFLGVKVAGTYSWQPYHLYVPIVLKSGSLNLLESSGLVQELFYVFTLSQWGLNAVPLSCPDAWDRIVYWAELISSMYRGKSNTHEQEWARCFSHMSLAWFMGHEICHTKKQCVLIVW